MGDRKVNFCDATNENCPFCGRSKQFVIFVTDSFYFRGFFCKNTGIKCVKYVNESLLNSYYRVFSISTFLTEIF